jgi:hypothetical protein
MEFPEKCNRGIWPSLDLLKSIPSSWNWGNGNQPGRTVPFPLILFFAIMNDVIVSMLPEKIIFCRDFKKR